jgi:hypothetical protein
MELKHEDEQVPDVTVLMTGVGQFALTLSGNLPSGVVCLVRTMRLLG